jgi:SWI/SNF-related matrix-associated actin-dependent regulator of chromatin subfamily A-like protein 1
MAPNVLKLDPHQISGAQWLAARPRAGLHDSMGLGKTATLIHALDLVGGQRGVVITTASTKEHWKRQFALWGKIQRKCIKGGDIYDLASWAKGYWDVLICSYTMVANWEKGGNRLTKLCGILDFLIIDEAHNIKTPSAERTIAVRGPLCDGRHGLAQFAINTWEATGTPIPNDPVDLWAFLRFTGVTLLDRSAFIQRYFYQPVIGKSRFRVQAYRQAELRALIQQVSLRRDIDVVNQPLRITQTYIDGDASKVSAYLKDHPGLDAIILQALEDGDLSRIGDYGEHVATVRRLIGEAKALPFAHYLVDAIKGGLEKAVVFGIHIDALAMVREVLTKNHIRHVYIDGSVPERRRQAAIDEFEDTSPVGKGNRNCKVFVANMHAGGEGITLISADKLYMMESDWTPKGNAQPIKRIHRRGQTRPCNAEFVTLAGSFDENIIQIVREKIQSIFEITNELMLAAPS